MNIETHIIEGIRIAEITSDTIVITSTQDAVNLLGNMYYQDFDRIIIHEQNLNPEFFDLKNGLAGDILQKFSNYRVRLAIIGDFANYTSKSITDFIYESNKAGHINFVPTKTEALQRLSVVEGHRD